MIGASGLSDDDDSNSGGLKWKVAKPFLIRNNILTAIPLSSIAHFYFMPERASILINSHS